MELALGSKQSKQSTSRTSVNQDYQLLKRTWQQSVVDSKEKHTKEGVPDIETVTVITRPKYYIVGNRHHDFQ